MNKPEATVLGHAAPPKRPWLCALWLCLVACSNSAAEPQSGSTNWLRCGTLSDCDTPLAVACSTEGYCVDEEDERITVEAVRGPDTEALDTDSPETGAPDTDAGRASTDAATPPTTYTSPNAFDAPEQSGPAEFCPGSESHRRYSQWSQQGTLLVGPAAPGLAVFDLQVPGEPELLGSIDVGGAVWGTWVADSVGGEPTEITALVGTPPLGPFELPPRKADLADGLRVLQIDISDPLNPTVSARLTLEGELLELTLAKGALWVLTALPRAPNEECPEAPTCVVYDQLVLTSYVVGLGDYEQVASLDLPAGFSTWLSADGLVLFASSDDAEGTLHLVRFGDDGVAEPAVTIAASSKPEAVQLTDTELRVVTAYDRGLSLTRYTPSAPSAIIDSNNIGSSSLNGDLEANFQGNWLTVNATNTDAPPNLWTLGENVDAVELPEGTMRVFVLPELSQGVTVPGDSDASVPATDVLAGITLTSNDGITPDRLALITLGGAEANVHGGWEPEDPEALAGFKNASAFFTTGSLLVSQALSSEERPFTGLRVVGDQLVPLGAVAGVDAREGFSLGDWFVMPDMYGVRAVEWSTGNVGEVRLQQEATASVTSGGWWAGLVETAGHQYEFQVRRASSDQDAEFTAIVAGAQLLILPIVDGFVVPATGAEACDSRRDHCQPHDPNVSIFSADPEFRLLAQLPMPQNSLEGPTADDPVSFEWTSRDEPPVRLDDGRWVFTAVLARGCHGESACRDFGAEPVFVDDEWRGRLVQRLYYVLNIPADASPYFGAPVISTARAETAGFFATAAQGLVVTRIEATSGGSADEQAFVEYHAPNAQGGLELQQTVNIPGRPARLGKPTPTERGLELYSVEPVRDSGGVAAVHRLALREGSASVLDTLMLPGYHLDLASVGNVGVQVASVGDSCSYEVQLTTFTLEPSLQLQQTISLGTSVARWRIVAVRAPYVLLEANYGTGRYAIAEVLEDGTVTLVAYQASACSSEWHELRLDQGEITCE